MIMILETKEDFENAVLKGEEIKYKTVFYTGEIDKQSEPIWAIGSYDTKLGIYAGMCNGKQIWVALKDAPKEMNCENAKTYCKELDADCDGWHLPTKEELMLIYVNKDIINKSLKEHVGKPMKDEWYWSSSEYDDYYAWTQHFYNGSIDTYTKNHYYTYVRPVLAL